MTGDQKAAARRQDVQDDHGDRGGGSGGRWRLVAAGRLLEPNSMHYPIPRLSPAA